MSKIEKEIRLDLIVKGTTKTFTQNHIPYSKALDYTDGEANLFTKDEEGQKIEPSNRELTEFRAKFIAGLFDDKDLTGRMILDGLDTTEKHLIMDIILYRVLGYERPDVIDPKEKKDEE